MIMSEATSPVDKDGGGIGGGGGAEDSTSTRDINGRFDSLLEANSNPLILSPVPSSVDLDSLYKALLNKVGSDRASSGGGGIGAAEVIHSGVYLKKNRDRTFIARLLSSVRGSHWTERLFVLSDNKKLQYYDGEELKGSILLDGATFKIFECVSDNSSNDAGTKSYEIELENEHNENITIKFLDKLKCVDFKETLLSCIRGTWYLDQRLNEIANLIGLPPRTPPQTYRIQYDANRENLLLAQDYNKFDEIFYNVYPQSIINKIIVLVSKYPTFARDMRLRFTSRTIRIRHGGIGKGGDQLRQTYSHRCHFDAQGSLVIDIGHNKLCSDLDLIGDELPFIVPFYSIEDALYNYILEGEFNVVGLLVSQWGVEIIEKPREHGLNAFIAACSRGHVDLVQHFLSLGVNQHKTDERGWTGLLAAAFKGNIDVCKLLISQGSDVNKVDKDGGTPILLSVQGGHALVFELLLSHGAFVDVCDANGCNAFYLACRFGRLELVKLLASMLPFSNNLLSQDKRGVTALAIAIVHGRIDVVKFLLETTSSLGLYLSTKDNSGATSFFKACRYGQTEIVSYLITTYPAAVKDIATLPRANGDTPMSAAVLHNHRNVITLLQEWLKE